MWAFPYSCLEACQLLVKIKPKVTTTFILCEELLALVLFREAGGFVPLLKPFSLSKILC